MTADHTLRCPKNPVVATDCCKEGLADGGVHGVVRQPASPARRRSYRLHFYLENGTCEILEDPTKNSGRSVAPVFLRRSLLPKVSRASCTSRSLA